MTASAIDTLHAAAKALDTGTPDSDELQRIGRRLGKALRSGETATPVRRVVIVSSFLTDMLADGLAGSLLRHDLVCAMQPAPYGALPSALVAGGIDPADVTVLLPTHRDFLHAPLAGCSEEEADAAAEREAAFWCGLWDRIEGSVIQLSFDPPAHRALDEGDGYLPGGLLRHARAVNRLMALARPSRVALVDAEALAARVGRDWHDPRSYALCKQPFANSALGEVAETLAAAIAGQAGKSRKVLVLDLDNTLWGGVIGDVGPEGIVLGSETAEGEAFTSFQRYIKRLADRGVILAVCSKNKVEIAQEVFRQHSGMVLRETDIACFVANFEDKAGNIKAIAQALNVGIDSLVFADDNPVERAWVREQLPEVLVIDMPEEPARYAQAIEAAKAFPMQRLTAEDSARNASYRARAETVARAATSADLDGFLRSLDPVATVEPFSAATRDRITQLIAKTNQFKMNPHTYTVEELSARPDQVIALSFADRNQDYGIVAVAVWALEGDLLRVENWVMSCRTFSRRLENAMLHLLAQAARSAGATAIEIPFTPSAKNGVAADFLAALGMERHGGADGLFTIGIDQVGDAGEHMQIRIREMVQ